MKNKYTQHPRTQTRQATGLYWHCVEDLIGHPAVQSMKNFKQHGDTDRLGHCVNVSYHSYRICRRLRLDYAAAARGGLLHDFFLYDWHHAKEHIKGFHGFTHPVTALLNAEQYFTLNERERDIIRRHMWPLTPHLPRYSETCVVILVDKYCAVSEFFKRGKRGALCGY